MVGEAEGSGVQVGTSVFGGRTVGKRIGVDVGSAVPGVGVSVGVKVEGLM
jgi:hypothetical protein